MNFAGTNASNFDTRSRFAGSLTVWAYFLYL
jgi:hypothetical protein